MHASPATKSSPVLLTDAQIDVLVGMSPISPPKRNRFGCGPKRRSDSDYVYSSSESFHWRQAGNHGHEATARWSLQPVDDCQLPQTREPQLHSSAAEEHYVDGGDPTLDRCRPAAVANAEPLVWLDCSECHGKRSLLVSGYCYVCGTKSKLWKDCHHCQRTTSAS